MKTIKGYKVSDQFRTKVQTAYDTIMLHLRKQDAKAMVKGPQVAVPMCAYITPEGLQCAIGCLIPEDLYHPRMEGLSGSDLLTKWRWTRDAIFGEKLSADERQIARNFTDRMQEIHDSSNYPNHGWIRQAHEVGEDFQVTTEGR